MAVIGAALDLGNAFAGLIADGIHVHPASIGITLRAKRGPGRIFLVTDADDMTALQAQQIESINRDHVVIHTINVGRSVNATGMLQQLARASGGQYLQFTAPR